MNIASIFQECVHTRDNLKRVVDDLDADNANYIMDLYLASFTPFEKRLKSRDETLFAEESCEILQHLQINSVWTPDLDEEAKTQIWNYLIGGYLIAEIMIRLPPKVMNEIEAMIMRQFNNVIQDDFDKSQFKGAAENIILNLDDDDIQLLVNYMWEFVTSDATPVYCLIPENFHLVARAVFENCKTEDGRQTFLTQIMPMIDDLKTKVGADSKMFDFNTPAAAEDAARAGEVETAEKKTERERKEKQRMVSHVLNVMTELISKNKDMIRNITRNPAETISTLLNDKQYELLK